MSSTSLHIFYGCIVVVHVDPRDVWILGADIKAGLLFIPIHTQDESQIF